MQPLNDSRSRQVHRARMQAEQTVTARSRLRRDLRAFCLAPLPRSRPDLIGKIVNRGSNMVVVESRQEMTVRESGHWIGIQSGGKHGGLPENLDEQDPCADNSGDEGEEKTA